MIIHGDCLEMLRTLPSDSVDALVTDPPAGISFMGKAWDDDKGGRKQWISWMADVMAECLRVMKPGAHGLVWAIPRTSHWTATALEDAGFEVRDVVTHLFGSGFPKSLDVSKAIDKAAGAKRTEKVRQKHQGSIDNTGINEGWQRPWRDDPEKLEASKWDFAPATDAAKKWAGFGTALKPAAERWVLVKKPYISPAIDREACYSNALIGDLLCRLSPAKFAGLVSTSNLSDSGAGQSASALWLVAAFNTLRSIEPSDLMDMFPSQAAASTFLNIASSWSAILDALLSSESKSTTRTASGLITDLRTLNSCLSKITPESITQDRTLQSAPRLSADIAGSCLPEIERLLSEIQTRSAHASATSQADSSAQSIAMLRANEYALPTGPFSEDFILVRKPCSEKTVAQNVLKWSTGALNIDASRISNDGKSTQRPVGKSAYQRSTGAVTLGVPGRQDLESDVSGGHSQGRFPANLLFSCACDGEHEEGCAVLELDRQSGDLKFSYATNEGRASSIYGSQLESKRSVRNKSRQGDSGGASRFFYCAKTSKSERNAGLETANGHPTVKPQKLMRYLCRMVTPPNGTVLDPFTGSGSTGVAALAEGFQFIGIEREKEYAEIAERRLEHASV